MSGAFVEATVQPVNIIRCIGDLRADRKVSSHPIHHELLYPFSHTTSRMLQFVSYTLQSLLVPVFQTSLMCLYQQSLVVAQGDSGSTGLKRSVVIPPLQSRVHLLVIYVRQISVERDRLMDIPQIQNWRKRITGVRCPLS